MSRIVVKPIPTEELMADDAVPFLTIEQMSDLRPGDRITSRIRRVFVERQKKPQYWHLSNADIKAQGIKDAYDNIERQEDCEAIGEVIGVSLDAEAKVSLRMLGADEVPGNMTQWVTRYSIINVEYLADKSVIPLILRSRSGIEIQLGTPDINAARFWMREVSRELGKNEAMRCLMVAGKANHFIRLSPYRAADVAALCQKVLLDAGAVEMHDRPGETYWKVPA